MNLLSWIIVWWVFLAAGSNILSFVAGVACRVFWYHKKSREGAAPTLMDIKRGRDA